MAEMFYKSLLFVTFKPKKIANTIVSAMLSSNGKDEPF
jgi:hypothetical protein